MASFQLSSQPTLVECVQLTEGVFVVMSLLWGWKIDGIVPDRFDVIGAVIVIVGVFVIMYSREFL